MNAARTPRRRPLAGLRILDASTVIAAPLAAMILADYGAEVIKVEHPRGGDPARTHGYERCGVNLWSLMLSRNKKSVTLYLGSVEGQDIFRRLASDTDVVIENFRPGVMERWGLDYDRLSTDNPHLVMAHVSGFGRSGPLADEPGFGTIGEAMSGFAFRNGEPDGPPLLPPFGLGDGVTGIATALAIMTALHERSRSGLGQEIDLSIIEPLLTILEPQLITQDQIGRTIGRTGNQAEMNAPRGMYLAADATWVAISASTESTASRLMSLVGNEQLAQHPWFVSASGRRQHAEEIDAVIAPWVSERPGATVVAECRAAKVPATPVYSSEEILTDPQFAALGSIGSFSHPRLGTVRMPGPIFRLSATPGSVEWLGPDLGAHTSEVLDAIGIGTDERAALRRKGII